ncbi:MAG TPA: pyruvate, phosphate dikinase, partial [Candidatus Bathyarchaeia archaeon]|nr:pyruvate, phosphate dikinase [Candidatus Bathyarchaeia archaeon]
MSMVKLFDEAIGMDKFQLGGKGYGLVEMSSIGLPIPPGIIITTQACKNYYSNGRKIPRGLTDEIKEKLAQLERKTGKKFGSPDRPLLLSVRSGAPFSMPGMMDTILDLGIDDSIVEVLATKTGNERFALDAYRRFIQMFGRIALGVKGQEFENVLEQQKANLGVRQDIDLTPAALRSIVREFKQIIKTTTGSELPQDPWVQLEKAVNAVFESWNNPRAKEYRKYYRIGDELGTAVSLQVMVFGNMGVDSGSGVGFTRNPSTGERKLYGEYLQNCQGEDVVAGIRNPESLDKLPASLSEELAQTAAKLEQHFVDMQDFEFTVENGKLYVLQTRNGKRTAQAAVKIAVDMVSEKLISKEQAITRVDTNQIDQLLHRMLDPNAKIEPIAKGLNASPGATSGIAIFDTEEAAALGDKGTKVILVRPETTPEDIRGIIRSQGVLTARGGMTSHAAVVARGMGKPAVVGCSSIRIEVDKGFFKTPEGVVVKRGDVITIDGSSGQVILGEARTVEPELTEDFRTLLRWADQARKLGVWANADTPD